MTADHTTRNCCDMIISWIYVGCVLDSQPAWESAPAMFYGGAFDVAVIWGLPPPLLLGVYSVRLLTRTTSLQRGPLVAPIAPVACS